MGDNAQETFLEAEEIYNQTRYRILECLALDMSTNEIACMQLDLGTAITNLFNAAIDFSRSELIATKQTMALIHETEMSTTSCVSPSAPQYIEELEARLKSMTEELRILEETNESTINVIQSIEFETDRVCEFERQKDELQTDIDNLKNRIFQFEKRKEENEKLKTAIAADERLLVELESELSIVMNEASAFANERDAKIQVYQHWECMRNTLLTKLESVKDDAYISTQTARKAGDMKAQLERIGKECDQELYELHFFKLDKSEKEVGNDFETKKLLKEINDEINNIKMQIDHILETRIRNSVPVS